MMYTFFIYFDDVYTVYIRYNNIIIQGLFRYVKKIYTSDFSTVFVRYVWSDRPRPRCSTDSRDVVYFEMCNVK